jgi:predicted nucleotide-binding protein (sugar kinase/HSP70/actin superfamily)
VENGKINNNKKNKTIGIPRALTYYLEEFNWEDFFKILGYDVIFTNYSSQNTFKEGFKYSVNDQCLPVKILYGHIVELMNKNVDIIFVPQIISLKKGTFSCPQVSGSPLSVKSIPVLNHASVMMTKIDFNHPKTTVFNIFSLALKLSKNPYRIFKAVKTLLKSFKTDNTKGIDKIAESLNDKNIGVIGRKYVLNDPFLNVNILQKIKDYGFDVITSEGVDTSDCHENYYFGCKPVHWYSGQNLVAAADIFMKHEKIKGIIFMNYFGCGIDAFIEEIFKKNVAENKPYLCLSLDEHTGEAGMITRIEAFVDMINRKGVEHGA